MSDKDIAKEANKQLEEDKKKLKEQEKLKMIERVKDAISETLKKIEDQKSVVDKEQTKLRILKKDLEDLRNGKFDKLVERRNKSEYSKQISIDIYNIIERNIYPPITPSNTGPYWWENQFQTGDWMQLTSGTYNIPLDSGEMKVFYF